MQVLPPVQLARSRVRGAAVREGRAPARPPARRAMDPRRLGRDKRDPPVRRIRRVTMWCRGRGRRPRRPARPMAFPCTCRAASVATSATLPYPARNGPAPPRPRQARPSRRPGAQWTRAALGRDKRDPPVPGAQWTRAALGRDKRDPPVRRIRQVTMWCRGRGRRPRRPARPMAFPCTCRAAVGRPAPRAARILRASGRSRTSRAGLPVSARKPPSAAH